MVAILGVVVPLGLGWAIMRAWGFPQVESVFVGAAMVVQVSGLPPGLAAKGLLHLQSAKIILGAAVIETSSVACRLHSEQRRERNCEPRRHSTTATMAIGFTIIVEMGHSCDEAACASCRVSIALRRGSIQPGACAAVRIICAASMLGVAAIIGLSLQAWR